MLAAQAAAEAGFDGFAPDACLVNRYEPGARLTLHQDKNERRLRPRRSCRSHSEFRPCSCSAARAGPTGRSACALSHGDVVVWGGPARLRYHGVLPLAENHHPLLGRQRFNLTFRKAG